ncbi:MAG: transposase family protein [Gammaproteobacteria bacterium]|nr:transposase family protein [Gammaproteobacteria bacterium]
MPYSSRGCSLASEVYPLPDKTNKCVWDAFAEHFLPSHGIPKMCTTDNEGAQFQAYLPCLGIEHHRITTGHPASNGLIERANKTIKQLISKTCNNAASR